MSKSLRQVEAMFAAWRARHRKRAPLPLPLKAAAVDLLGRHSVHEVTSTLRTSRELLIQWQDAVRASRPPKGRPSRRQPSSPRRRTPPPAFVDVTALAPPPPRGATLTVEIAGRGTIKLSGELTEAAVRAAVLAALGPEPRTASSEVIL